MTVKQLTHCLEALDEDYATICIAVNENFVAQGIYTINVTARPELDVVYLNIDKLDPTVKAMND